MAWFKRRAREEKPPARRRVHSIHRDALRLIMAASKEQHPKEFGATLRAEKGVITEIVLTPGTIAGDRHTFINYHMLPIDPSVVGTVHSHPSPHPDPSDADKRVFSAFGHTHIIIAFPYNERSWVAYDLHGDPIELEVVS